ncbi:PDZK1-interacting protein 1 isoform X1 [Vulpes lagopus]|uniref:PDZK1-interacting protein 1 isoform X1 n=1 Tax=Vulpes lagopus TaxID=494514 RepID=UPI001BC9471E|nr:PDZK1-interacting protein 1 isoform X1 [Vulpes lagopus]
MPAQSYQLGPLRPSGSQGERETPWAGRAQASCPAVQLPSCPLVPGAQTLRRGPCRPGQPAALDARPNRCGCVPGPRGNRLCCQPLLVPGRAGACEHGHDRCKQGRWDPGRNRWKVLLDGGQLQVPLEVHTVAKSLSLRIMQAPVRIPDLCLTAGGLPSLSGAPPACLPCGAAGRKQIVGCSCT